jgi:hypothetical protein
MGTEDGGREATLYCACRRCLERAARDLQLQGLPPNDIAAILDMSPAAVELLLVGANEAER